MRFVIMGNGIAGVTAARALSEGGDGAPVLSSAEVEVEIYAREAYHYYPRPRLYRFLAGEVELEDLYSYPPAWYEKRGIAVHLGVEVVELDPVSKRITLSDGRQVSYDRLLLATGGRAFVLPLKGVDKEGIFTLRTIEDALAIREWAREAKRAVVIGGGLLGLETARSLRGLGLEVTILELEPYLLPRQLDAEGAELLRKRIEDMGIEVMLNARSQAILGDGKATGVLLEDGREIAGDLILISAGIRSNVQLAQDAGLEVQRGVVVDEHLRTSAEDIYAAGDVAEFQGRVYGIIPAAIEQARAAAANMLGREPTEYRGTIPSNTLQVVGIDCASIGVCHPPEGEGYQELRKPGADAYKKLVLKDGRLVGAILLGDRKDVMPISRLIREEADVSPYIERLLDEDFNWKELLSNSRD
jgi:nitrite reductase (NADH) large subunit